MAFYYIQCAHYKSAEGDLVRHHRQWITTAHPAAGDVLEPGWFADRWDEFGTMDLLSR